MIEQQYSEMSSILEDLTKTCPGLLSVSLWEYDFGDMLLYPGRRTRENVNDKFAQTSIDSCEIIRAAASETGL